MRPRYAELPQLPGSDLRHAWDFFGAGDSLGMLNLLTERRRHDAAGLVRSGATVNLSLPLTEPSPSPFGRRGLVHEVYQTSSFSWDDRITGLDMQASSQWDGLLHVRHRDFGFYGGRQTDPEPFDKLGVDRWVEHGIVGRGVLVDLVRYYAATGAEFDPLSPTPVPIDDVARAARAQGTELVEGDVLCLRFGWLEALRIANKQATADAMLTPVCAGLDAGPDTARFLWDTGIAALACDNPAVEVQPGNKQTGYLHHRLLTMLGMPLGELFTLDELADRCHRLETWEFLFVSVPLNVPGAIGSPANAIAVL